VADWAGIEARCNPWLSNHVASEAKLDIFRSGGDVYVENAKSTFNVKEVTKDQRFIGKVQELALGYSGGAGAFASMARIYGLKMPEHQIKRMINGWRIANPWCIPYGQELERAYMSAMRHKGHEFSAGRVTYLFDGEHLWYILPSRRVLNYPFARIEDGAVTYLKAAFKPASDAVEWPRARLWQGIAQENCAQATANDLLRYSLRQLDGVIAHIHDEIVVECKADDAEKISSRMVEVMCTAPSWCSGLPLDVEINTMERYSK
jgi:DNA polymerase